jgi:hypothetical protein
MKKLAIVLSLLIGPVLVGRHAQAQLPPAFTALGGAVWIGGQKCAQIDGKIPCDAQYGMSYPLAIWPRPENPAPAGRIVFGAVSNLKQGGLTLGWRVADAYTPLRLEDARPPDVQALPGDRASGILPGHTAGRPGSEKDLLTNLETSR